MNTDEINELADIILQTRDFCGNEADAVRQWESDNNHKVTSDERRAAFAIVNTRWRESQRAAGVRIAHLI